jgi:hypothetical protein
MTLRHVHPGDRFKPRAEEWNAFIDAAERVGSGRVVTGVPRVQSGGSGGAEIIQFVITSVDCVGVAAIADVTDVICEGATAVIGDEVDLLDPLNFLAGNPEINGVGVTGMAVKMSEDGIYGDCTYKIIATGISGYNC